VVAGLLVDIMRDEIGHDPIAMFGTLFMRPALRRMRNKLGLGGLRRGTCSRRRGVLHRARSQRPARVPERHRTVTAFVENRVNQHIREEIESDHETAA